MAGSSYFYKDVLPFFAMFACESINVVLNVLFKAATLKGLSYHVFMACSYAVSTLVLLPLAVFSGRRAGLPALELSLLYRIFLLGLFGYGAQICGYKGIEYSSPTLASAISNLTPAFTFILAVIFRMEQLALRRSSTLAKVAGTVVSISGALVVVLYEGPTLITISSQLPSLSLPFILGSSQTNWVSVLQTQVMKMYPSEIIVSFLYNLCGTIISAPTSLMAETNMNAWRLKPDIALVAIVYSGISSSFMAVVHSWGLRLKGPVYISIFKPLSIAIAAAMGVIFLGDALYLGSVVGAIIISIGFYAVIWGKAKEEEMSEDCGFGSLVPSWNGNWKDPFVAKIQG
ncbi:hypothetical protein I3760_03G028900 [Carya illinoinensis]|nr:hypothetical protein I3760_03G028900 [Carya illinoinensis]